MKGIFTGVLMPILAPILTGVIDKAVATTGDVLTYTIMYENTGGTTLNDLKIVETMPAFTTFAEGACGTLVRR